MMGIIKKHWMITLPLNEALYWEDETERLRKEISELKRALRELEEIIKGLEEEIKEANWRDGDE